MDAALSRVAFRRHLTPVVVPGDATYLVSEQGVTAIGSEAVAVLAPLLDGSRDLAALVRDARGKLSPAVLGGLLAQLTRAGLVDRFAPPPQGASQDAEAAFWECAGLHGDRAREEMASARVLLKDLTAGAGAGGAQALTAAGLTVDEGGGHTLTVVLCDDYLSPDLAGIDREQRLAGTPWLLAKPSGVTAWIGPVFQPAAGACWQCLSHRVRHHRQSELYLGEALGMAAPPTPPRAATGASHATALHMVALQASKWLAGFRHESQHAVCTLDSLCLVTKQHRVERRPQCAECGDPLLVTKQVRRPVRLTSRPKLEQGGGGHRALPSRQILERYEYLVGEVTGVVHTLRRDPRCPEFLNSYLSGSNPAVVGRGLRGLRHALRAQSGGKGVSELDAKVGALCEALERYSATYHGDEPRTAARLSDLGTRAVHPNQCQLYHERQFTDRLRWNGAHPAFQYVCDPLDEDAVIDWTPVWSVTHGTHRMLPTGMLYYSAPGPSGACYVRADSNGNAAGASLEDAVLQGFFELVERDAVALWWYNRSRVPGLDLDSFADPWLTATREQHGRLGREIWALDLTSDLGVPVVAALSRITEGPREDIAFGFGAHFDPGVAMRRAVTELNQLLPGMLDARTTAEDPELLDWCTRRTVANQPYLLPDPEAPARVCGDFPYTPREDLLDDVLTAEALVRARGMELLVLDQTRPDLGIPVVKVMVPGLRHFWARFADGRLYDVPVQLGRQPAPTPYDGLNPIPVFV
ncbi:MULTISPECIES: TOMM precursor leader peptide-binding protein [unclassified Streptomyces]|uniref:TOMM precursor leader peptide-binding protein n=1 Tax=unclassified Streptomyces TaxID=2593676 RepID=UPI002DDC0F4E|nr:MULTISPECIES: TOMM precursor leader peptide-binding protein [unclassified Streptomyces]WSA95454.1 TOMM precursor leader peptide-binding protein [Streptomyces sp. NBC_01795]WSB79870.1 TOMM precursor leader peptide-binding protein [Streptomyces sp. NBC_01775]WSS11923.1 TOMM precursor leader peptide-binding protein [Streptomyces sp. NBC_01186]WSS40637.1 TOMM precursor leader peptide-binding protein [Streptomyces sp. NBC_01187]